MNWRSSLATTTTEPRADDRLALRAAEQTVLVTEVAAFAETLREPTTRARYAELLAAVQEGVVPSPLVGALEAFLELVLPLPRIRREHGPEGARALSALFGRTPRGTALKEAAAEVNAALAAFRGQTLESVSFSPTPGGHNLAIETAGGRLAITIDRAGVRVDRLDVAGI
jgi:hypothetical protein